MDLLFRQNRQVGKNVSRIQNFESVLMKLEALWQNSTTRYITTNLFRVIISFPDVLITVKRIKVIQMLPFQRNFSFGAVHSADEKHLSTDTYVVSVANYSMTNF